MYWFFGIVYVFHAIIELLVQFCFIIKSFGLFCENNKKHLQEHQSETIRLELPFNWTLWHKLKYQSQLIEWFFNYFRVQIEQIIFSINFDMEFYSERGARCNLIHTSIWIHMWWCFRFLWEKLFNVEKFIVKNVSVHATVAQELENRTWKWSAANFDCSYFFFLQFFYKEEIFSKLK